ncbi:TorF family putative porin [Rhodoplanes sp. TEM]|uniref:TorF family putative porin n=1 Tax=Rhodoplanes tepidamans TaxID=200616 RepID=A0ABT5JIP4_RHOTP|nr:MULTISPECIES: TorF family putative porin [Rhodoplanes]MDC7789594.1 TorF family putative porin [Rhodoplanes tepidamans]MDC7985652.1 TorF family putative porin [Rhodoplanes sp. TEM]MDQ0357262.1 uncharacterized protein (TIGR02001 family) [Rhodoplanes tepidamans]
MKKIALATVAITCLAGSAFAADMAVKAPPIVAPVVTNPWDLAFGAGIYSDYNFRGISQSDRGPSVNAYFEPRYNVNSNLQLYAGIGGWSINFANNADAEIDIYGGIRPTFGALALDFGVWYYYYPGGQCFNTPIDTAGLATGCTAPLQNGNVIKKDLSFLEYYAKATYTFSPNVAVGAAFYYDDNWLNFGFDAQYLSGNIKLTAPSNWLPTGFGMYVSGEVGHYWLGTTDSFYGNGFFPLGVALPDYTTWNVGIGLTWKVFTVDLRYYDTDLSEGDCNAITGDHTATFDPSAYSLINTGSLASKWCGQAYVISLKADLTLDSLK